MSNKIEVTVTDTTEEPLVTVADDAYAYIISCDVYEFIITEPTREPVVITSRSLDFSVTDNSMYLGLV